MKKVLVIGCPGSGKSTFSKSLHALTGLPLVHLDLLYWNPDRTTVEDTVFHTRLSRALQQKAWIIDGNYAATMEQRLQACDTVFFLDYPLDVCLSGVRSRTGTVRSDLPWTEPAIEDAEFISFIQNFPSQSRPHITALLERYAHKEIHVFSSRAQADAYLQNSKLQGGKSHD